MNILEMENRTIVRVEIDGAGLLSDELTAQLGRALDQAEDLGPTGILFLHLIGHKSVTSLHSWPGEVTTHSVSKWERVLRRMERTSVPTILLMEQTCNALALELLLVADRRIAHSNLLLQCARAGEEIWPSMSLYRLSRQIGEFHARKLLLNATDITAERSSEANIVDDVVDSYEDGINRFKQFLRTSPLDDFAIRRRLMQDSLSMTFDDALGAHLAACDRAVRRAATSNQALMTIENMTTTI